MRHYINTNAAELSLARSVSLLAPVTPRPMGAQAAGNQRTDEFVFHRDGAVEAWSGGAGYSLRVAVGPVVFDAFTPSAGPPAGWSGVLDLGDPAILSLLAARGTMIGDFLQCSAVLTVEVTGPGSAPVVYYQTPIILRAVQYDTGGDDGMIFYLRPTFYSAPAVTGLVSAVADATKLGGLSGLFAQGATVQLMFPEGVVVLYTRIASVADESSPWLVRPWNFDAVSNAFEWQLDSVTRFGQSCTYNAETGRWHYLVASGPPDAVTVGADQTGVELPA